MRHPIISDMIKGKIALKTFPCWNGLYRVNDFVIENMVRLLLSYIMINYRIK